MFVALAVFAAIAAVHGHALVIALVFLASFFPDRRVLAADGIIGSNGSAGSIWGCSSPPS